MLENCWRDWNDTEQNRIDWELKEPPRCKLWYEYFNNLYENQLFEMRISKLAKQTTFKSVIKSYLSLTNMQIK